MHEIIDFFRHSDVWLQNTVNQYGTLTYAILFAIVFAETGLVIIPFLPGDSLLFAVGAFSVRDGAALSGAVLYPLFMLAAFCGDNLNYFLGRTIGRRLFSNENSRLLKKSHLTRTEAFFDKHGGKALILARFVPIVRTFAPFVAGMGKMPYARFLTFSVLGAALWVGVCVTAGRFFGNMEPVKKNFEIVVLGIVLVSLAPVVVEFLNHRRNTKKPVE